MRSGSPAEPLAPLAGDALVRLLGAQGFAPAAVAEAVRGAAGLLPEGAQAALAEGGLQGLGEAVLLERQFGPGPLQLLAVAAPLLPGPAAAAGPRAGAAAPRRRQP